MPLCDVLLNDDKTWPWVILVPRRAGAVEIHDLSDTQQVELVREISTCSRAIHTEWNVDKMNVGALGCVCRQLHVHVLGRFTHDMLWPAPVWGASTPKPYGTEVKETVERMAACVTREWEKRVQ